MRNATARRTRGQTLSIFVLAIVCLLGMAALAVDVGAWYLTKRRLQAATDHAALAGAGVLGNGVDAATGMALAQGRKTMRSATFTVTTPYRGDATKLQVIGRAKAQTFFASIFGLGDITIASSGAAQQHPASPTAAIFAMDSTCGQQDGLLVRGNSITASGSVHSNGTVDINWNGTHGPITYGGPNNCKPLGGNSGSGGGTVDYTLWPWPEPHVTSEFCPTPMPSGNITLSGAFTAGVYCTTGDINVTTGAHGSATMVGNRIRITDHNITLDPFVGNVLAFATGPDKNPGTGAIDINGNNMTINGTLFAPNGRIIINGNTGTTFNAFLEGYQVELDGNHWDFTGTGSSGAGTIPSLIE